METNASAFRKPSAGERVFNRLFGFLVGIGIGLRHNYLLQVAGRKSGRVYSTPVDLLELRGKRYLVAPRGRTQWVRNAETANQIILKKGFSKRKFSVKPLDDSAKPEILKAYLEQFKTTVQRYFPVAAGSEIQSFVALASNYPVFELTER